MKRVSFLLLFLAFCNLALAKEDYLYFFNNYYPGNGLDERYECFICHENSVSQLNTYGTELQNELRNRKLFLDLSKFYFRKTEDRDSDKDGIKNIDEINNGTNPGINEKGEGQDKYAILGTGSLNIPRYLHSAVVQDDGSVLVTGGAANHFRVLDSVELFNPAANKYSLLGSRMSVPRWTHTATVLDDGKIIVAGGSDGDSARNNLHNTADIFDSKSGKFISVVKMNEGRAYHTATKLLDGRVLFCGGSDRAGLAYTNALKSAEIFDPKTGRFEKISDMNFARQYHRATLLKDGRVLISGGSTNDTKNPLDNCEIFEPKTNKFSLLEEKMTSKRIVHVSVLLKDGRVLLCGGLNPGEYNSVLTADLFDPETDKIQRTSDMNVPRIDVQGVCLENGEVVIAGGSVSGPTFLGSVEIFNTVEQKFYIMPNLFEKADNFSPVKLNGDTVLVIGGMGSNLKFLRSSQVIKVNNNKNLKKETKIQIASSANDGAVPLEVKFSMDEKEFNNGWLAFSWDFGDGCSSDEKAPTHVYYESGEFVVSLCAIDNDGYVYLTKTGITAGGALKEVSYGKEIQPVFDRYCIGCHGSRGELSLISYNNLMQGGKSQGIVNGNNNSKTVLNNLLDHLTGRKILMPPRFVKLPQKYINRIKIWINQGAKNN